MHIASNSSKNLQSKLLQKLDDSESLYTFEENMYLTQYNKDSKRKASIGASSFSDENISDNEESLSIDNAIKEKNEICQYCEREIGNKRYVDFKWGHFFHKKWAAKDLKSQIRADKFPYYCCKNTWYKFVSDKYIAKALGDGKDLIRSRYIRYTIDWFNLIISYLILSFVWLIQNCTYFS